MKKIIAFLLCFLFVIPVSAAEADVSTLLSGTANGIRETYGKEPFLNKTYLPAGESISDWLCVAFSLSGEPFRKKAYLKSLSDIVRKSYGNGTDAEKYSANYWNRLAITVAALGENPKFFSSDDTGKPIDLIAVGTYNYNRSYLSEEGTTALSYALIVSSLYSADDSQSFTDSVLQEILQKQNPDGSFGLSMGASDVDVTAIVLQGLAPFRERTDVLETAEKAFSFLQKSIDADGLFPSETSESISQVLLAYSAFGMEDTEPLLSALEKYRLPDGTYRHILSEKQCNLMATSQAMLALTALKKQQETGERLFDFSNGTFSQNTTSHVWIFIPIGIGVLLSGTAVCLIVRRRKKNNV